MGKIERGPWGGDSQCGASNWQGPTGGGSWEQQMLAEMQQDQFTIAQ